LSTDLNETLADQNEINEDTCAQQEAISEALNELQNQGKTLDHFPISVMRPFKSGLKKKKKSE